MGAEPAHLRAQPRSLGGRPAGPTCTPPPGPCAALWAGGSVSKGPGATRGGCREREARLYQSRQIFTSKTFPSAWQAWSFKYWFLEWEILIECPVWAGLWQGRGGRGPLQSGSATGFYPAPCCLLAQPPPRRGSSLAPRPPCCRAPKL